MSNILYQEAYAMSYFQISCKCVGVMLLEIKGKVMNVALETLEEEGLYIAADSQTEGVGTTHTK